MCIPNMTVYFSSIVGGPSAAVRSAAVGAILLALIEGVGICITRMTAEQFKPGLCFVRHLLNFHGRLDQKLENSNPGLKVSTKYQLFLYNFFTCDVL